MGFVNIDLLVKFTICCILLVVGVKGYANAREKSHALALTRIEASSAAMTTHMLAGHADSIALMYAEDAVVMPANAATIRGRDGVRALFASYPPLSGGGLTIDTIVVRGDLAYVRGRYSVQFADSTIPADSGKYIEIRRRGDEGQWLIIEEVSNSSIPLPQGTP
jgi:ketosteroid isomerase-like protein